MHLLPSHLSNRKLPILICCQPLHVLQVYPGSFSSQEEAAMAHDLTCKTLLGPLMTGPRASTVEANTVFGGWDVKSPSDADSSKSLRADGVDAVVLQQGVDAASLRASVHQYQRIVLCRPVAVLQPSGSAVGAAL